jgi:hypothetical protein
MEREMNSRRNATPHAGSPPDGTDLDEAHGKLESMLHAADKILDSIPHAAAEEYLQQSKQRGGQ